MMKPLLILLAGLLTLAAPAPCRPPSPAAITHVLGKWDRKLAWAYENEVSEIRVTCSGKVVYKLPDDIIGIRHQRFLVELKSGQTLLIAHNIDLAKRVRKLRVGDKVVVHGEYIWNEEGGLIHYTHRDPAGIRPSGWIKHRGAVYK